MLWKMAVTDSLAIRNGAFPFHELSRANCFITTSKSHHMSKMCGECHDDGRHRDEKCDGLPALLPSLPKQLKWYLDLMGGSILKRSIHSIDYSCF